MKHPIGMMDSGFGGISILGEAVRLLPNEDFLYYGDTAHIPYGSKTPQEVYDLTSRVVEILLDKGCKAIVIACNTATSVAVQGLREKYHLPIIGVEPAVKPAALLPGSGRVAVMATPVTLRQPKFEQLKQTYAPDALLLPCPGLMECVEAGEVEGDHLHALLQELLRPCEGENIKAVVLGCTHYPFLRKAIRPFFAPEIPLMDGGEGVARQIRRRLAEENLLCEENTPGKVSFLSSAAGEEVLRRMEEMLALWQNLAKAEARL